MSETPYDDDTPEHDDKEQKENTLGHRVSRYIKTAWYQD
jgi:hypothetical protein